MVLRDFLDFLRFLLFLGEGKGQLTTGAGKFRGEGRNAATALEVTESVRVSVAIGGTWFGCTF